jgi:hypothetical protein
MSITMRKKLLYNILIFCTFEIKNGNRFQTTGAVRRQVF